MAHVAAHDHESHCDAGGINMGRLPERIGYGLRRAQLAVFQDFFRAVAETGITPTEYSVLTLLAHNVGLRPGAVAEALGVKHANFVRVQERLETAGLISRTRATDDRRAVSLALTDAGAALLADLDALVEQHDARMAAKLSAQDRTELMRILAVLARD